MAHNAIPAQDLAWQPAGQHVHLEPHTVDGHTVGHDQDVVVDGVGLTDGATRVLIDYHAGSATGRTVYETGQHVTLGWVAA